MSKGIICDICHSMIKPHQPHWHISLFDHDDGYNTDRQNYEYHFCEKHGLDQIHMFLINDVPDYI